MIINAKVQKNAKTAKSILQNCIVFPNSFTFLLFFTLLFAHVKKKSVPLHKICKSVKRFNVELYK